ncbi:hypothetical protein C8Q76DRAFT_792165 [Earliella scabrosa]|nr:hypothetical protein C8Q76DRAFT_792165 [Earliella scabrosa]
MERRIYTLAADLLKFPPPWLEGVIVRRKAARAVSNELQPVKPVVELLKGMAPRLRSIVLHDVPFLPSNCLMLRKANAVPDASDVRPYTSAAYMVQLGWQFDISVPKHARLIYVPNHTADYPRPGWYKTGVGTMPSTFADEIVIVRTQLVPNAQHQARGVRVRDATFEQESSARYAWNIALL